MLRPICIDFDGIIHSFTNWHGATVIDGEVVPGAMSFLATLMTHGFQPVIYSNRSRSFFGRKAMASWIFDRMYQEVFELPPGTPLSDWRWSVLNGYTSADNWDMQVYKAVKQFVRLLQFPKKRPLCYLSISTKAIQFVDQFPTVEELNKFRIWGS